MKILFHPPFRRKSAPSLVLLVAIAMLGTMALHMFVPALPAAAADLHASPGKIQLTVTLYLIGLAVGQLVYGPLSDRFGRRPLLLGGMTLYFVACIAAALAQSADTLIVARVFQSLGGCAGLVLGRAMVRDGTTMDKAARRMSVLMTVMTIGPALAPAVGGYVTAFAGWRATFAVLAIGGGATLLLAVLLLAETHSQRRATPGIGFILHGYRRLLGLGAFRGFALTGCCTSTSLYAYFTASPFIFVNVMHRPLSEVGLYYMLVAGAMTVGTFASSRLLAMRIGSRPLIRVGTIIQLAGTLALLATALAGVLGVATLVGAIMVVAVGSGLAAPNASICAVSVDAEAIGTASGLYGSLQMAFGALCTLAVSAWHSNSAVPMAAVLAASALLAQVSLAYALKTEARGRA